MKQFSCYLWKVLPFSSILVTNIYGIHFFTWHKDRVSYFWRASSQASHVGKKAFLRWPEKPPLSYTEGCCRCPYVRFVFVLYVGFQRRFGFPAKPGWKAQRLPVCLPSPEAQPPRCQHTWGCVHGSLLGILCLVTWSYCQWCRNLILSGCSF